MSDVSVLLDDGIGTGEAVHDARVLNVRAVLEDDASEVAAQARGGTDITVFADDHVADQHGARMDEARWCDDRRDAVDREYARCCHAAIAAKELVAHPDL